MRTLVCALFLAGCDTQPTAPATAGARLFGAPLTATEPTSLDAILKTPDAYAGKQVTIDGHVRKACQTKGCWMEVAASDAADAPACRVTFKDYGFFVPKTSAGARTRLQGTVEVREVTKEHVAHYEAEGAHFAAKAADGSAREVRIIATGVELTKTAL